MKKNGGQVTLVALLVMVVLLTVGLAVVSRSVTDIRISKEAEESARAFSAAEAGIEDLLKENLAGLPYVGDVYTGSTVVGGLTVGYTVEKTNSFQTKIAQNDVAEVNLKNSDGSGWSGNLEVVWSGKVLELTLIYKPVGLNYRIKREVLGLTDPDCNIISSVTNSPYTFIVFPSQSGADVEKVLRIRPICNEAEVTVASSDPSGNPLPDQSYTIRSSGTIPESRQTRTIELTKSSLPILPPIFDYVLFSGGELRKP